LINKHTCMGIHASYDTNRPATYFALGVGRCRQLR